MELYIIIIIKALLLSFLITRFQPLQDFIEILIKESNSILISIPANILVCIKCTTFWITLFMSGSIYIAIVAMILAWIYDNRFKYWENKIKLF